MLAITVTHTIFISLKPSSQWFNKVLIFLCLLSQCSKNSGMLTLLFKVYIYSLFLLWQKCAYNLLKYLLFATPPSTMFPKMKAGKIYTFKLPSLNCKTGFYLCFNLILLVQGEFKTRAKPGSQIRIKLTNIQCHQTTCYIQSKYTVFNLILYFQNNLTIFWKLTKIDN